MKKVTLAIAVVALLAVSSEMNASSGPSLLDRAKTSASKLGTNMKAAGSALANSSVGQAAGRAGKKVSAAAGAAKARVLG